MNDGYGNPIGPVGGEYMQHKVEVRKRLSEVGLHPGIAVHKNTYTSPGNYGGHNDEWRTTLDSESEASEDPVTELAKQALANIGDIKEVDHWRDFGTCPVCKDDTKPECVGGIFICQKCDWRQ